MPRYSGHLLEIYSPSSSKAPPKTAYIPPTFNCSSFLHLHISTKQIFFRRFRTAGLFFALLKSLNHNQGAISGEVFRIWVLDMVRLRSSSNSQENDGNSDELIPGLPEEIAELCLLHVPYPYQALARSVSSSWNKAITDPSFLLSKKTLSLSQPYLFVFASSKSTSRIQWQALDPRSGRWFVLPPMPCSAAACPPGLACASLPEDGKLFVLGDLRSDGTSLHTTIMYRASTNQWSLASPMRTPRTFFAAGSINGKIFAAGGRGLGVEDSIPTVERYDPVSDTWAAVAKMRSGLARYDAAVVGNKLYVTEGWTWPFSFSPRGGVYDADRDTWQEMSLGMREGWTGISVVLRNRLFVLSEYGDCRMKVYVPDHDTWHPVGGGRFPCEALQRPFAVSTMEDMIYVVSRGLHVAVGKVHETVEASQSHHLWVEWEVMAAPIAFSDFSPCNCQPLYA